MSLIDGLISHWSLDEASGTRADSHGTNDLTDNNTVTSAAGKIGVAASFAAASSEYLSRADNAGLRAPAGGFTIAAWVNPATAANQVLLGKTGGGLDREYYIRIDGIGGCNFVVTTDGSTATTATTGAGTVPTSTWSFVVAWHDPDADTINVQVNDSTPVSAAFASAVQSSSGDFVIGRDNSFGGSEYFNGLADSISLWGRVLTADERDALYNGGDGLNYDAFAPASGPLRGRRPTINYRRSLAGVSP